MPLVEPTYFDMIRTQWSERTKRRRAERPCGAFFHYWGGRARTYNLLVNSQALCQLSYAPSI